MFLKFTTILVIAILLCGPVILSAEEGMWPLDRIDKELLAEMKGLGLELSQKELYAPGGSGVAYAIVNLGGGTGSFISSTGLILTNHHVGFTALQRASTSENNILQNGFYAGEIENDIPAEGYQARVLVSIKDVTEKVLKAAKGKSGAERYKAIEDEIKRIELEGEKDSDLRCSVSAFYSGMEYRMYTSFIIKDIRIAYAPPRAIGNYGGDIDNWMWPRHTGDFTILRAYVAPDGSSAEYAEENVPYKPAVHLAISSEGVEKDDFTMILGFPAATQRYRSSYSIEWSQNWRFPNNIGMFGDIIDIYKKAGEKDPAVAIKVASYDQMLNNSMKNYQGQLEGFRKASLLDRKTEDERAFTDWVESDGKRKKKYGDILPSIGKLYKENEKYRAMDGIGRIMSFSCQMVSAGMTIFRWTEEKQKEDFEREPAYMERNIDRVRQRLGMIDRSYDENVDRTLMKYLFRRSIDLPEEQRSKTMESMIMGMAGDDVDMKIDNLVEKLYSGTKLGDASERNRMFDLSREDLMKENDTFIEFCAAFETEIKDGEKRDKEFAGILSELRPLLIEGMKEWKGGAFYPDANGTMRLTYGTVKGYWPRDAVYYDYITSFSGMIDKNTGEEPFDCPHKLVDLHGAGDLEGYVDDYLGDLPVDFLSTCDITGGNSGSPILNGKGEVIGAAFDGNWESISADYLFNSDLNRCISVESRYILFVLDRFSGADGLLKELTIH
ncbi:MAG: S46 family peptidase [Candidatus Krumholzibacteriota bacterium]|nr:S46 family peptidase [Candidatus Krumholzibacteriota bacterium]